MQSSQGSQGPITVAQTPAVQYLLRIADTCLIHSQRTAEWSGRAPVLEEDIALSNLALDLIGQARAVLTHAATLDGQGHDEDRLAFLRSEGDYRNLTMAELPRGDFAFTVVRNVLLASFFKLLWTALKASTDSELAGIAGKAVKEARYHQQHAADWLVRLADGSAESRRRTETALDDLWRYTAEFFAADAVDEAARASDLGPSWSELQAPWLAEMQTILTEATLGVPAASGFLSTGKGGVHSEHMGYILAEMQHLQRAFPGGAW
jgi:ring-1,2-phenylacetyl-CoA epoxidase subunit PaaC